MYSAERRINVPPEKRALGMVFQSYAVWPHMTVFENVAYGLKLRRLPRSSVEERVRGILDLVHLRALADRYPGELSGGQQQRVALARALVVEPETLLLDEPLSNLDAHLREEMRFEIRRLHEQYRITTVYVTHDQAEAMVIADRIAVMNQGRIEQFGSGEEIYERPQSRSARCGSRTARPWWSMGSTCASSMDSSSACSGRRAAARRPPCACWRGLSSRKAARSSSAAACCPARARSCRPSDATCR